MRKICFLIMIFFLSLRIDAYAEVPQYKVGVLLPLTGNFASYGSLVRDSIRNVNIDGVSWVFEDEVCEEPAKTLSAFKKLREIDNISFFIGPGCGSPQSTLAAHIRHQDVVVLLPNAAPSQVFSSSGRKMYSVQYSLETEGGFLAKTINDRRLTRVAIVSMDNDFSQTIINGFLSAFRGQIIYHMRAPAFEVQYMKIAAIKLKDLDFDSIFIPDASPLLLGFLSELKKVGISRRPTFSAYGTQMPDVIASERENANGLFYSYPDVPDEVGAFGYFPTVAAKLLGETVSKCLGRYECVKDLFASNSSFNSDGTLAGRLILKTIVDGKFTRVSP